MMAAITASRRGHHVTIIEHNGRVGKKLLVTGNGRCNYTNVDISLKHFHGGDKFLIDSVLRSFDQKKTVELFNELGVFPKEINGGIYPFSEQASAVLDCLRMELIKQKIDVVTEAHPNDITKIPVEQAYEAIRRANGKYVEFDTKEVFKVITNQGTFYFDKLIIATGSKAQEKTGSDGSGYEIAKKFGHSIRKPLPALCALRCKGDYFKSIAGVRCDGTIKLLVDGEIKKESYGGLQLTDYGVSGIPTFQISYLAARALDKGKNVSVILDFIPEISSVDELYDMVTDRIKNNPDKAMDELLIGLFNKALCAAFNKLCGIEQKTVCSTVKGNVILKLCKLIKNFKIDVLSTNSFENAQVCSGGVKLDEVKNTLESKIVNGLYFAGEILDVNGDCGGYNLQFAWSSGYVAGCLK